MNKFYIVCALIQAFENQSDLFSVILPGQTLDDLNLTSEPEQKSVKVTYESVAAVEAVSMESVWKSIPVSIIPSGMIKHRNRRIREKAWSLNSLYRQMVKSNWIEPEPGFNVSTFTTNDYVVLSEAEFIALRSNFPNVVKDEPTPLLKKWKEIIDRWNELTSKDVVTEETREVGDVNTKMTKESILKVVKPYLKEVTEKRILDLRHWEVKSLTEQDNNALRQNRNRKSALRFKIEGYRIGYCSDGYWAQSDRRYNSPTYYLKNGYVKTR